MTQTEAKTLTPTPSAETTTPERRGCSGCAWVGVGAVGCLLALIVPIIILLVAGVVTINGITTNIQDIFNAPRQFSAQVVLERVQSVAQLTTVRYNYSSVVTVERDMPPLIAAVYGERQVMVAVGFVTAGIDLAQLTADDIVQDGRTITINLPAPTILDCFLDESETYVISRDTGLFARNLPNLDEEARRYAVIQFRDLALANGILADVETNAQTVIGGLIKASAPDADWAVRTVIAPPDPNAPPPPSCQ